MGAAGAALTQSEEVPNHDPVVLQAAAGEWLRRVEAEYTSAARTHGFVGWLIRVGAPPELIRAGMRIVDDELEHAHLSAAVVTAAGSDARPELPQAQLELAIREADLISDLCVRTLEIFCLGETVAVPLFVEMRRHCTVAPAKAAFDRIVRDEVRHRDFGWEMLDWLLAVDAPGTRARAKAWLPRLFAAVRKNYGEPETAAAPSSAAPDSFDWEAGRAWGLMPVAEYGRILARCFERDFAPRFEKRGIDAQAAWRAAH